MLTESFKRIQVPEDPAYHEVLQRGQILLECGAISDYVTASERVGYKGVFFADDAIVTWKMLLEIEQIMRIFNKHGMKLSCVILYDLQAKEARKFLASKRHARKTRLRTSGFLPTWVFGCVTNTWEQSLRARTLRQEQRVG